MLEAWQRAIDELSWRFGQAASAIGVRAQSIADGGVQRVFDTSDDLCDESTASARAHLGRRRGHHRNAVQRMVKIDATLGGLDAPTRETLRLAFEPSGRATHGLATILRASKVSLVALAIRATLVRSRNGEVEGLPLGADTERVLAWLEVAARKPARAEAVRREAISTLSVALARYDERLQVRLERERASRREQDDARAADYDRGREERDEKERVRRELHHPCLAGLRDLIAARSAPAGSSGE